MIYPVCAGNKSAEIYSENDTSIGKTSGFLLYNDVDFLDRCDAVSGDCETIASVVCKNDGSVLKKFLSKGNEYDQIFIIEINEDFRMKEIATSILTNLPSMLSYQFGDAGTTIFHMQVIILPQRCTVLILFNTKTGPKD